MEHIPDYLTVINMVSKSDFTERLNKAIERSELSVPKIAEAVGVDKENLYKWTKGKMPSNPEEFIKMNEWIGKYLEHIPDNKGNENAGSGIGTLMQAVLNLTESNRILAESNQTLANSNEKLVMRIEANYDESGLASSPGPGSNTNKRKDIEEVPLSGKKKPHSEGKKNQVKQKGIAS